MRLFDPTFKYVPSSRTDVAATWRRFGFRPTTESERQARGRRKAPVEAISGGPWPHLSAPPANARSN